VSFPRYPKYRDSGVEWLGLLPEHWPTPPLAARYEILLGKMLDEKRITGAHSVPYLRNQDVQWGSINTSELPTMDIAPHEEDRYTLRSGDLLVCEGGEVGRAAIWDHALSPCGFQKALHRLRPRSEDEIVRFLYYCLRFAYDRGVFVAGSNPNTIPHLTGEMLRRYRFPSPPAHEQLAIVKFLDRETSRVAGLMAEQERLIELLQEKRQAAISHIVSKGIDPTAKFKPSGVAWLGDIPEHWSIVPSRRLFRVRSERVWSEDRQLTASQKYGIVYQSDFVELEGRRVVETILGRESLLHVEPDDFVISMRSFQGGLERSTLRGSISFHYVMLTPIKDVYPPFFAHLFKSIRYIQALRATSNLIRDGQELRFSHFVQVPLPLIPLDEQKVLAEHIDEEVRRVDQLTAEAEKAIRLLEEHRAALISAAVTGKIDVRRLASAEAA